jgi:hypothetical protein
MTILDASRDLGDVAALTKSNLALLGSLFSCSLLSAVVLLSWPGSNSVKKQRSKEAVGAFWRDTPVGEAFV